MSWQFPKEYTSIAVSVGELESERQQASAEDAYDIDKAWGRLRREHAEKCQRWLAEHSRRIVAEMTKRLTPEWVRGEAAAHLVAFWNTEEGSVYTSAERNFFSK